MAPRIVFDQELEQLKEKVAEMGELVETGYDKLLLAAKANDVESLENLLDSDRQMVDMLRSIEARCLALMIKQQPVARDLRLVTAALKVVTDMERIGDHVGDMAELFLRRKEPVQQTESDEVILKMMDEARTMVRESVEAFVEGDAETARMVIDNDDVVDGMFNQVKEDMMHAIQGQTLDADRVVDNLMIAKYLEKVGDHAVNIGKWTRFRVTGELEG